MLLLLLLLLLLLDSMLSSSFDRRFSNTLCILILLLAYDPFVKISLIALIPSLSNFKTSTAIFAATSVQRNFSPQELNLWI